MPLKPRGQLPTFLPLIEKTLVAQAIIGIGNEDTEHNAP